MFTPTLSKPHIQRCNILFSINYASFKKKKERILGEGKERREFPLRYEKKKAECGGPCSNLSSIVGLWVLTNFYYQSITESHHGQQESQKRQTSGNKVLHDFFF